MKYSLSPRVTKRDWSLIGNLRSVHSIGYVMLMIVIEHTRDSNGLAEGSLSESPHHRFLTRVRAQPVITEDIMGKLGVGRAGG